ncbi:MAG TPA: hypothetical protein VF194_12550 [Ferrovibrio sp.]|uniref:hypothetical protein n=1 Tax=Ferrovibrio sp. TaxID=1917215 RepID=UPI002ECFBEBE
MLYAAYDQFATLCISAFELAIQDYRQRNEDSDQTDQFQRQRCAEAAQPTPKIRPVR